jgi:hypothetical protein
MGRVRLIAGAMALVLAAAGAFFWSDIRKAAGFFTAEEKLVTDLTNAAARGGYSVTFSQTDAKKWRVAAGHRLEKLSLGSDTVVARLVSASPLDKASFEWPTQGLSVDLPTSLNVRSAGKGLEIGVVARAAAGRPNATMSIVYATRQAGNSGWQTASLGNDFELKQFRYKVPVHESGYTNQPVLVINADASGGGGGIELLGVYIKIED